MKNLAPIVLFVFNRPQHTLNVLQSLRNNYLADQSVLYIIADGAKEGMAQDEKDKINSVRQIIKQEGWCSENIILEKDKNEGLANSIINAVTDIVNKHGKIIVLEDDLILSKHALRYFNYSLNHFEGNTEISCIHGYSFPANYISNYFFLKGGDCWGWGTWKNKWADFERNGDALAKKIISGNKKFAFDFYDSINFFQMLTEQAEGKNNSWAIRWYASLFLKNKLTLYPKKPFVLNMGNDGTGYHTTNSTAMFDNILADSFNEKELEDVVIEENKKEKRQTARFFSKHFLSTEKKIIFNLKLLFNHD